MTLVRLAMLALLLGGVACATRSAPTSTASTTDGPATGSLTVRLLGLKSDDGLVAVALYDSPGNFDRRSGAVAAERIEPRDGDA